MLTLYTGLLATQPASQPIHETLPNPNVSKAERLEIRRSYQKRVLPDTQTADRDLARRLIAGSLPAERYELSLFGYFS
jgi:hypothetical protein